MQSSLKKEYKKPNLVELTSAQATQGMASNKADMGTENGSMMTSPS